MMQEGLEELARVWREPSPLTPHQRTLRARVVSEWPALGTAIENIAVMVESEAPPMVTHVPCCMAHGIPMDCERYRRTHFVEVRPCCTLDRIEMERAADA